MAPKLYLVTGANRGIGYAIVKQLVLLGHHVLLGCRSEERATEAIDNIAKEFKDLRPSAREQMEFIPVDLEHRESFAQAAERFKSRFAEQKLSALINNADITVDDKDPIEEQAEKTIKVNCVGTTEFTKLFLEHIEDGGRIVFMGSRAGSLSFVKNEKIKENLQNESLTCAELQTIVDDFLSAAKEGKHAEKGYPENIYGMSKTILNVYARCLAREDNIKGRNITVNACCPGSVKTDMNNHKGTKCAEEGADTPVWLATSKEVRGVSGKFFGERREISLFATVDD